MLYGMRKDGHMCTCRAVIVQMVHRACDKHVRTN